MLQFKFNNISDQFENPIVAALIITVLTLIFIVLIINNISFNKMKYLFIGIFGISYIIIWNNYYYLTKKFYTETINKKENDIINNVLIN